ncbi:MAG: hypothetical protein AB1744_15120, partial [Candidatus Zixiibacteriota bacterium]
GEGIGINVLLGAAQEVGDTRIGGGVMYQYNGGYDPYEGVGDYNPGDFISVNGGADWQRDELTISGNAIFTTYFDDKLDGEKVFKQSTQFDVRLGLAYETDDYGIGAGLGYLARGRNTFYSPGQSLDEKIFGDEFSVSASYARKFSEGWYIKPLAELRLIGENDQDFGSSDILGFGAMIGRKLNRQVSFSAGGKYYTGSADDGNIDLSGYQLTAGLSASL